MKAGGDLMLKDFQKDTWEDLNNCLKSRKFYVYGIDSGAQKIVNIIKKYDSRWKIDAFLADEKNGEYFNNIPVYPLEYLNNKKSEDFVVLITDTRPGIAAKKMDALGVRNYFSYFWLDTSMRDFLKQDDMDCSALNEVNDILSDDKSKRILTEIIRKRKTGFMDYTDIMEISSSEYFIKDFFQPLENEVFVDGGAYDGDTIEEFVDWTKNNYKKIYAFEPDPGMLELIKKKQHRWHNLELVPKGLWGKNEKQRFKLDDQIYCSRISDSPNGEELECVTLENIVNNEKCTFIKMDIEGAEKQALIGAKKIIQSQRPRMAICIYHLPTDLWEIPLMLHKWVPEYKMYIRHFGCRYYGTVLYVTI